MKQQFFSFSVNLIRSLACLFVCLFVFSGNKHGNQIKYMWKTCNRKIQKSLSKNNCAVENTDGSQGNVLVKVLWKYVIMTRILGYYFLFSQDVRYQKGMKKGIFTEFLPRYIFFTIARTKNNLVIKTF